MKRKRKKNNLDIQNMKITVSSLKIPLQIDGEKLEIVTEIIFLGSKITADGDCSQEIKRHLLLWRKAMTNLNSILKRRHYFAHKRVSQRYGFSSSHVGYESWIWVANNWCFWTVVLEKTLESPLDCKEIKPVHPKGNKSWYSLEGLMPELKLQFFGHLMWRADSLEKPWCWEVLKAGGEGDNRGWDGWMASLTQWTWVWASSRRW